jgi:hypothetical protein
VDLFPANIKDIYGQILEKLGNIMDSTRNLGDQSLKSVMSQVSNVLEEIKKIEEDLQNVLSKTSNLFEEVKKIEKSLPQTVDSKKTLKWYDLKHIEADQPSDRNNKVEKEEIKKHDNEFKIIVLGVPEKTAFIHKFITDDFREDLKMTIGADFSIKKLEIDSRTVTLRIWDFAAEERFRVSLPNFVSGADGGILMYDVVDTKILKEISEVIDIIRKYAGTIPIFLTVSEVPSKERQFAYFNKKYTLTELTSEVGPKGEYAFEFLTKKILERKVIA